MSRAYQGSISQKLHIVLLAGLCHLEDGSTIYEGELDAFMISSRMRATDATLKTYLYLVGCDVDVAV